MRHVLNIIALMVLIVCISGSAEAENRKYDLPLFSGEVPKGYHYKDLGMVEQKYSGSSFLKKDSEIFGETAKSLVAKAKAKGANALVSCKLLKLGQGSVYIAQAEAVFIDKK